jgi:tyrosyl-tRNA synthetase
MWRYYELLTDLTVDDIGALRAAAERGERNPRDIKVELAKRIIADFHPVADAQRAEDEFNRVFRNKQAPDVIEERTLTQGTWELKELLVELGLAASKAEGRRLIEQGGVYVNGERCDPKVNKYYVLEPNKPSYEIKVGKRRFLRVSAE